MFVIYNMILYQKNIIKVNHLIYTKYLFYYLQWWDMISFLQLTLLKVIYLQQKILRKIKVKKDFAVRRNTCQYYYWTGESWYCTILKGVNIS